MKFGMAFIAFWAVCILTAAAVTPVGAGEISPVQKCDKGTCVQKTATQKSVRPGDGTIPLKYKLTLQSRIKLRREARAKIRGIRIRVGRVSVSVR